MGVLELLLLLAISDFYYHSAMKDFQIMIALYRGDGVGDYSKLYRVSALLWMNVTL